MATAAEAKLSPAERISLQSDVWASVRVGREPVGDYLAFTQGIESDRSRAVLEDVLQRFDYIAKYLVTGSDRESYRIWLRQYLSPILKDVGWEPKPGEGDEQRTLRSRLFQALGDDARDPEVLAKARQIADQALANPESVDRQMAFGAFPLAALNGDEAFYDRVQKATKDAKSPEEYYMYLFALADFSDPKLLQRTLDYAISPDVRSQDTLQLLGNVIRNPDGEKLAWDFALAHWDAVQKAGGPFASASVVGATGSFCDAHMRDQVVDFFAAHRIEAAERTYRQSIERINNCIDLKTQQQPQLAVWLGEHGTTAGGQ
jgi:aminopeptidase N/puromycin-sensitive aminopeptidase